MRKTLTIHIGTHKTGTSSLQRLIKQKEDELRREGTVLIDYLSIPRRHVFYKSTTIDNSLIGEFHTFIKREMEGTDTNYLLLWEGFSGDPRLKYSNRKVVQEMLYKALPKDIDIELVVFFRSQNQFIQSIYTQFKHEGEFALGTELLQPQYHEGFDWNLYMKQLTSIFKEVPVHVFPYERTFLINQPLRIILGELLGSNILKNSTMSELINVGMNQKALELFEKLAPRLNKQETKYLRGVLQKKFNKGILNDYTYLAFDVQQQWINLYQDSNRALAKVYWNEKLQLGDFQNEVKTQEKAFDNLEEDLLLYFIQEIERYRLTRTTTIYGKIKQRIKKLIS